MVGDDGKEGGVYVEVRDDAWKGVPVDIFEFRTKKATYSMQCTPPTLRNIGTDGLLVVAERKHSRSFDDDEQMHKERLNTAKASRIRNEKTEVVLLMIELITFDVPYIA